MLILVNCILGCPWFLQRLLEHTNERGTVLYNPRPLIIQKYLDLWKLDFSLSILLYRETCNICTTCSLCSLLHFFDASQRMKKNCLCTLSMEYSLFFSKLLLHFFSFSSDTIFTDTVSVMGIV